MQCEPKLVNDNKFPLSSFSPYFFPFPHFFFYFQTFPLAFGEKMLYFSPITVCIVSCVSKTYKYKQIPPPPLHLTFLVNGYRPMLNKYWQVKLWILTVFIVTCLVFINKDEPLFVFLFLCLIWLSLVEWGNFKEKIWYPGKALFSS